MGWGKEIGVWRQLFRVGVVFVFAGLTAACFQPLYGDQTLSGGESLRDRLATVEVANIPASNGTPASRLAVELRNDLMYDFNGGQAPVSPTHQLHITISPGVTTVLTDISSGRTDTQIEAIDATFSLSEIATKKVVLNATTFARASFDIPGTAQRFAKQRAWRDAEDRAIKLIAENIRNRLASFFVAGT
jgi:LPS-assembly lipoprotein